MIVEPTDFPGVIVIRAPVHEDERGFFTEVFHHDRFDELGLPTSFAQDSHSHSARDVLRGLHYQLESPQGKLVRTVRGDIFDVAVDLRRSSPHFGRWTGVTLKAGDGRQLWIPPGFAHGFLVLSDSADVTYKCTTIHRPPLNRTIRWDDSVIAVRWPLSSGRIPILSAKDADAPSFAAATAYE